MARDVGMHLPPETDFIVIWGSMSPRTVGRYHPHITCVQHSTADRGASVTYSFDLDSEELPALRQEEAYQRECYKRLIGVTCAAVPSLYAGYQVSHDRMPELDKFYKFLGEEEAETKRFRESLEPLTRWIRLRDMRKDASLRRIADIETKKPYPLLIVNEKDNGIMALITDAQGRPRRFKDHTTGDDVISYIDVLETTASQYVTFLKAQGGNKEEGGAEWLKIDPEFTDIVRDDSGVFRSKEGAAKLPVINVNWFGARAYCRWAGKALPREEEWVASGSSSGEGPYPWGMDSKDLSKYCSMGQKPTNRPGGLYPKDRSRVGCFDMAGNVAEWCEDWFDEKDAVSKRVVAAGSFEDRDPKLFEIRSRRGIDQVNHLRWVGFRGVVRLPIDKVEHR
jgi:hypothetical protein